MFIKKLTIDDIEYSFYLDDNHEFFAISAIDAHVCGRNRDLQKLISSLKKDHNFCYILLDVESEVLRARVPADAEIYQHMNSFYKRGLYHEKFGAYFAAPIRVATIGRYDPKRIVEDDESDTPKRGKDPRTKPNFDEDDSDD